jgi:cytochrome c oxidase cbb3-type subunit 3
MVLQGRMINPRVVQGDSTARRPVPVTVTVTEPNGRTTSGALVQVNDFYVTLVDGQGARRTFNRDNDVPKVVVHDPAEAHRQMMMRWKDQDMWNVTAYLASLK